MKNKRTIRPWQLVCVALGVYVLYAGAQMVMNSMRTSRDISMISELVTAEELILELTGRLKGLAEGALNLTIPGPYARELFADQVQVVDLDSESHASLAQEFPSLAVTARRLPVHKTSASTTRAEVDLWRPLLEQLLYFEHAKFYVVRGQFDSEGFDEFTAQVGFKGLARTLHRGWRGIKGKLKLRWRRDPTDGQSSGAAQLTWRIVAWDTQQLELIDSQQLLFVEALDEALPEAIELRRARQSEHQRALVRYYQGGAKTLPTRYFSPISANLKPGLSVVDVDQDGHDDLYVTVRMGNNLLLRNRGDGTFEEVASKWGLDVDGDSTCAIFADFDNDGDPDLMLGRSIQRSAYMENTGSRFHKRQLRFAGQELLPYLAVSMSAADYNGDGLLDIYISTYRPAVLENIVSQEQRSQRAELESGDTENDASNPIDGIASSAAKWPDEFLTAQQSQEYYRRHQRERAQGAEYGNVLDQIGPPNVLLMNLGEGRFGISPGNKELGIWRNSLQATWADFDEDGDPDLYIANDWADDNLFRNDGVGGFVDITQQAGTSEFGFAMGATWGDYDNDGYQDLYVSNMFSKAGRRITSRVAELNPSYMRSVEGNYLYRREGDRFRLVSGLEPPALTVADAGWSWGGQFTDLDNDGFLDIYVLSGYFTPPEEFSTDIDL